MTLRLLVYEDPHWGQLSPLADVLPVPALAFGAATLLERWRRATGLPLLAVEGRATALAAWHEPPVADARADARDDVLVANAAALPGPWLASAIASPTPTLFTAAGRIAGARLPFADVRAGLGRGEGFETFLLGCRLPGTPVDAAFLAWPWDVVAANPAALTADLSGMRPANAGDVDARAVLIEPERIRVEAGARVDPLAVLDARGGPILIGPDVVVQSHTVVTGPCAVGAGTQLLGGAIGRSTIGPQCRIAGEVEECVWQGWANKRHHGFVGHSVIGAWANLGALTTTSDLKNNYGTVRVWAAGAERDSGSPKIGSFIGAHVKTGIGTLLPTGGVIGVGANLFGGGRFAPKHVPAFAWWDGERAIEHRFDAFLDTARTALGRRGRTLSAAEEQLLRAHFDATLADRGASARR